MTRLNFSFSCSIIFLARLELSNSKKERERLHEKELTYCIIEYTSSRGSPASRFLIPALSAVRSLQQQIQVEETVRVSKEEDASLVVGCHYYHNSRSPHLLHCLNNNTRTARQQQHGDDLQFKLFSLYFLSSFTTLSFC